MQIKLQNFVNIYLQVLRIEKCFELTSLQFKKIVYKII